jgi:hypothetical protein
MTNNRQDRVAKIEAKYKKRAQAVKEKINKTKSSGKHTVDTNRLELMITIVGRNKAEFYLDLIQSFEVNLQVMVMAHGTADATMRSLLGLTDSDKTVIFSIVQENMVPNIMGLLDNKFKTIKNGKGVAFTVPMSSVIGALIFGFLSNNTKTVKEEK